MLGSGSLSKRNRAPLYMMIGESLQLWENSIPPVDATRYSITFRTMAGAQAGASRPLRRIGRCKMLKIVCRRPPALHRRERTS